MKRMSRFILVALVAVLALSMGISAAAQDENILVIGWEQEPPLLTPRSDLAFGAQLQNFYARGLWDWDVNREIFPIMVEEIPSPENGMVETLENGNTKVTYKLREGLLWSDGEAITSADCAFWHELTMDPTTGTFQRGSYVDVVESFEVIDDLSFSITYNVPFPDYTSQSTATCSYPEHVLRPALEADGTIDNSPYFTPDGVNAGATVGYGPYVISEWIVGDSIRFEANPNWDGQAPAFDVVITRFILDTAQMQNALSAGEIDVAFNFSNDFVEGYQAIDGVEVFGTPGVFGDALWMNYGNNTGPIADAMADKNVRIALVASIDRPTLAEQLVGPGTIIPKAWHPETYWPEDLGMIEYDPEMAAQLLDEAGWVDADGDGIREKDGVPLVISFFTTDAQLRGDFQIAIQEYWSAVGIGATLQPVPAAILFGSYLENGILSTGAFDVAIFALSASALSPYADAPEWFGCDGVPTAEDPNGSNGWGSCSPEYDALDLEVGRTVDPAARLELAQEAIREFVDEQFWHGLYLRQTWYAINTSAVDPATARDVGTLSSNYFNKIEFWAPPAA
jgi:peptide/nickel transport system substrate-binding protein